MALKNDILEILENNRTKDVSGQELAERLRVTRAAVWKAVKVLKADGHSIEAVRNRGYRLSDESDIISREGIKSELKHSCDVMVYRCVDSTNTTAKLAAVGGAPAGTVIIAEMQTGGKGRRGRSFYSPGEGGV
ncbi:MAG: biotin operon repressor, partial [Christensenellales bacterium]